MEFNSKQEILEACEKDWKIAKRAIGDSEMELSIIKSIQERAEVARVLLMGMNLSSAEMFDMALYIGIKSMGDAIRGTLRQSITPEMQAPQDVQVSGNAMAALACMFIVASGNLLYATTDKEPAAEISKDDFPTEIDDVSI